MSVQLDGATSYMKRTTNLPTITSATIMGWAAQTSDPAATVLIFSFGALATDVAYWTFIDNTTNQSLSVYEQTAFNNGTIIGLYKWNHIAFTIAGTGAGQCKSYLNGVLDLNLSGNAGPVATAIVIGAHRDGIDSFYPGKMAGIKIYSAVLNGTEIATEYASFVPVRTSNINGYYPMKDAASVGRDDSGQGNNFTVVGTFATSYDEPLPTPYPSDFSSFPKQSMRRAC